MVRVQYGLSAVSLGITSVIAVSLAAANRPGALAIGLFLGATLLGGGFGGGFNWARANHAATGALEAPPDWAPPRGGRAAWALVLALPIVLALLVGFGLPQDAGMVAIPAVIVAIAAAAHAIALARAEGRSGMVLVSNSVWRAAHPLKIPAAELARLESGRAASGAAR
ncbi:MAG: hypothetical protein QOK05_89 [Chloroflexota bacterium]|nr:hypothetical protein [Chloroflexota bacterium]